MKTVLNKLIYIVLMLMVLGAGQAWAITYIWTGATDTNFETAGNWDPAGPPANDTVNGQGVFSNMTASMPFLTISRDINGLIFTNFDGGWTLGSGSGGYALRIGAGGINATAQTSGTNYITADIRPWNTSFNVGAGGLVWISGNLTNSSQALTIGSGPGHIGTVKLSGDNSGYSGSFSIQYGTLAVASSNAFGTGALTIGGLFRTPTLDNVSGNALTLTTTNPITFGDVFTFTGTDDLNMGSGAVTLSRSCNATVNTGKFTLGGAIAATVNTLTKSGAGTLALTGVNTNSGNVTISAGALQANDGVGLFTNALLRLNGGVLQGNGVASFTRVLGTTGTNFQWLAATGGGFSAAGGQMTVNIGNDLRELTWGTTAGTTIYGSLKFGSSTANAKTLFQNPINLNAATRTIDVATGLGGDSAEISGVIRTASGTAGLIKTGSGMLVLSGANTYNGFTIISNGVLQVGSGTSGTLGTGPVTNWTYLVFNRSDAVYTNVASISGTGTVCKVGTGTVTFSGTNTYSGSTIISNGVLRLTHQACLATNTSLYIYSGATNDLAFAGTNTIYALYINGTAQAVGLYSSGNLSGSLSGTGYLKTTWSPLLPGGTVFSFF